MSELEFTTDIPDPSTVAAYSILGKVVVRCKDEEALIMVKDILIKARADMDNVTLEVAK